MAARILSRAIVAAILLRPVVACGQATTPAFVEYASAEIRPRAVVVPCAEQAPQLGVPMGKPVIASLLIDSSGRPMVPTIQVGAAPGSEMETALRDLLAAAMFTPGRVQGQAVAVRWTVPVYFGRASVSDTALAVCVPDKRPEHLSSGILHYPSAERESGIQGIVIVRIVIDTVGHVVPSSVHLVSAPTRGLADEAAQFIAASTYRPGRYGDRAVPVMVYQPVNFQLKGR